MRFQNGGMPRLTSHRTNERTSWSHDHIAITGIYSIGSEKPCSLCGGFGSRFWVEEWGYPPIGIYFAATTWCASTIASAVRPGIEIARRVRLFLA